MDLSQLLIYGLLAVGFLLFNYLLQRAARRVRQQQDKLEPPQDEAPATENVPIGSGWGRSPPGDPRSAAPYVDPTRRVEANAAAPAPPPRRPAAKALFRTTQDLRRAVVLMTVLAPCRALEPHDRRQT